MQKKVFVSGCFDLLHSGHVQFFKRASGFGRLYVSIGSDKTITQLKKTPPFNTQKERLFMVSSIRYVFKAFIAPGSGMLDFSSKLKSNHPDIFIVNQDGDTKEKRQLCKKLKIRYVVLPRIPARGLPVRSTTKLKSLLIPAR